MKKFAPGLLGTVFALTPACQGTSVEVLAAAKAEEGSCLPQPEADPCATLPRFIGNQTNGRQNVNALAQPYELCELPPTTFQVNDGAWKLHPELRFPEVVVLRVGWSPLGLHFYARVFDPRVVVSPDDEHLENGDSVEIYSAATAELHGPIDGTSDGGAQRLVIAPPLGSLPARGRVEHQPRPGVIQTEELAAARGEYAATLLEDGYAVEAKLLWPIDGVVPLAGDGVGFDFALNIADRDAGTGREQQSAIGYRLPSATDCPIVPSNAGPALSCDNRTWCTPRLE